MHMKIEGRKLALNLDMHGILTQELKIVFKKDGMYITSVDPTHVALVKTVLFDWACDEYNIFATGELEIGLDFDKIRDFLKLGKPKDVFTFDYDPESKRLVARLGNLVRTMGLLDSTEMPDPGKITWTWSNKTVVDAKVLHSNLKAVSPEKKGRFSLNRAYMIVKNEGILFENYSDDNENRSKSALLRKDIELTLHSFVTSVEAIFNVLTFERQVREYKRQFGDLTIETNTSTDPIKVSASNNEMTVEYYHAVTVKNDEYLENKAIVPHIESEPMATENTSVPAQEPTELEIVAMGKSENPELIPEPIPVIVTEPSRAKKPSIRALKKDIGWLASPRDDMHLVGEIIRVSKNGYIILFRGSKKYTEPVEYEPDLVEVYRKR